MGKEVLNLLQRIGELPTAGYDKNSCKDIRPFVMSSIIGHISGWWATEEGDLKNGEGTYDVAFSFVKKSVEWQQLSPLINAIEQICGPVFYKGGEWPSYIVSHKQLYYLCKEFGEKSLNRFIPDWVYKMPTNWIKSFLLGCFRGLTQEHGDSVSSSSRALLEGIQKLVKNFGFSVGEIYLNNKERDTVMQGGVAHCNDHYAFSFSKNIVNFLEEVEPLLFKKEGIHYSSVFVKHKFLIVITYLWDSAVQIFDLKVNKAFPILIREELLPRFEEEGLVNADLISLPRETLYEVASGVLSPEDALPLLIKGLQCFPEDVIDLHNLQNQIDRVVNEEIQKFEEAQKNST